MLKSANAQYEETAKSWNLKLLRTPLKIVGNDQKAVTGMDLGINR